MSRFLTALSNITTAPICIDNYVNHLWKRSRFDSVRYRYYIIDADLLVEETVFYQLVTPRLKGFQLDCNLVNGMATKKESVNTLSCSGIPCDNTVSMTCCFILLDYSRNNCMDTFMTSGTTFRYFLTSRH